MAVERLVTPPAQKQEVFLEILRAQKTEQPGKPIIIAPYAPVIGLSKQGIHNLYDRLAISHASEIPPKVTLRVIKDGVSARRERISEMINLGYGRKDICETLGISLYQYDSASKQLKEEGRIVPKNFGEHDDEIARLRREEGLGNTVIAKRLGIGVDKVRSRSVILIQSDPSLRLRARRRTTEELTAFDQEVERDQKQGYSYREIAEKQNTSIHLVKSSVRRRRQGNKLSEGR